MKASSLKEWLKYNVTHHRASLILGEPGCGKTSITNQVATELSTNLWLLPPLVSMEPVDMRGLPYLNTHAGTEGPITSWARADHLPPADFRGILFADEALQADRAMQSCLTQLFAPPYRLGDYYLPKGAIPVICSNRRADRAGVQAMLTQLGNRFRHTTLEPDAEEAARHWLAKQVPGCGTLASFIRFKPALISTFDPSTTQQQFASARTWEEVGKVLADPPPGDLLFPVIAGDVGEGPAAEIIGFKEIWDQLPNIEGILKHPDDAKVPKEPSVLFALTGALVEHVRVKKDSKLLTAAVSYATRLPAEFGVLTVRDLWYVMPAPEKNPAIVKFVTTHKDILSAVPE